MKCPHCGSRSTSVRETRSTNGTIRRRRQCSTCRRRFWTLEAPSATGKTTDALVHRHDLRNAALIAKDLADALTDLAGL